MIPKRARSFSTGVREPKSSLISIRERFYQRCIYFIKVLFYKSRVKLALNRKTIMRLSHVYLIIVLPSRINKRLWCNKQPKNLLNVGEGRKVHECIVNKKIYCACSLPKILYELHTPCVGGANIQIILI